MSLPPILSRNQQPIDSKKFIGSNISRVKKDNHTAAYQNESSPLKLPVLSPSNYGSHGTSPINSEEASHVRPDTNDLESPTLEERSVLNESHGNERHVYELKLPHIMVPHKQYDGYKQYINKWKRASDLKRTESTFEYYAGSPSLEAKLQEQNNIGRSKTHAAFLLPIGTMREKDISGRRKKKKKSMNGSPVIVIKNDENGSESSDGEECSVKSDSPVRYSRINHSSFDRIMEENESGISGSLSSRGSIMSVKCDTMR